MAKVVSITLDKERHLKYDGNAMARWSKETGHKISDLVALPEMTYDELRALLWACLAWEDRKLTIEQVGEMMDVDNLNTIYEKLAEAVSPFSMTTTNSGPQPESSSASTTIENTSA